jgi:hypothetical protein
MRPHRTVRPPVPSLPLAALLLTALVLAGCSGSPSARPSGRGSAASGSSGSPADPATVKAISAAYATLFSNASSQAQSVAALQHGATFSATIAAQGNTSVAQKAGATVHTVRLVSADVADVTFSVTSGSATLLKDAPGNAVRENGTWKVAAKTFCGLLELQGDAPKACQDTTVTALPD